jgi:hypothetical protein
MFLFVESERHGRDMNKLFVGLAKGIEVIAGAHRASH